MGCQTNIAAYIGDIYPCMWSKGHCDGVYFDGGPLFEKRYSIQNDRVKHIYTSRERAQILNDLLIGIKPYIKQGDHLFAYGSFQL